MADKMQAHTQDGEEIVSLTSDMSEELETMHNLSDKDKDKNYAKRMLARRRIEIMRDEKELEKQLTHLDWPEKHAFRSQ